MVEGYVGDDIRPRRGVHPNVVLVGLGEVKILKRNVGPGGEAQGAQVDTRLDGVPRWVIVYVNPRIGRIPPPLSGRQRTLTPHRCQPSAIKESLCHRLDE